MGRLKDLITKLNVPNDVPDEKPPVKSKNTKFTCLITSVFLGLNLETVCDSGAPFDVLDKLVVCITIWVKCADFHTLVGRK